MDGGCLRQWSSDDGRKYTPDLIEQVAKLSVGKDEELLRVLYYDCAPFNGTVQKPISHQPHKFVGDDFWLTDLAKRDFFAVRRGVLKFRGWDPRKGVTPTSDNDFTPRFEQKGVDMRIGLDIASYSTKRLVDRIAVITADTDMVPALKYARQSGLQVVLIAMSGIKKALPTELVMHADIHRNVAWP